MKRNILLILCATVLLSAFIFNTAANTGAVLSSDDDKLIVALSAIYKKAGNLVISLPYATINLSQTALMKVFAGETDDALAYLNAHAAASLEQNAYNSMELILIEYDEVLSKYGYPAAGAYRTKRAELAGHFSGLKSSSSELIRRTRALITGSESGFDGYYSAYCQQLIALTDRLENSAGKIDDEYNALIKVSLG